MISEKTNTERGFSLVELIASLVIAGILAVSLMTIVVSAMDGYFFARDTVDISQKAQLALARMRIELLNANAISEATTVKIVFTNEEGTFELERTGTDITLKQNTPTAIAAQTLVDGVDTNPLFSYKKNVGDWDVDSDDFSDLESIEIDLKFTDFSETFETTINPRANRVRVAPRLL